MDSDWVHSDVWRIEEIPADAKLSGPAIIESDFTSIVVNPGATVARDDIGNLVIHV
jgi:N-methylhydantoinase A